MTTWQPIETAPKDGTSILLADNYGGMQICWWDSYDWRHDLDDVCSTFDDPTHWMPLPPSPK